MTKNVTYIGYNRVSKIFLLWLVFAADNSIADMDAMSVTMDNDLFVGNDSGYTNGLYVSFFDVGELSAEMPEHDFWVSPLMWSMPSKKINAINSYLVGQTLNTPSDITIAEPAETELPYSAMLFFTNNFISVLPHYTDKVSFTLGVIGPVAMGEETQTFVHDILSGDEPLGWDTQLENELVFQVSRARTWRSWVSRSGRGDFLTNAELTIGTIQSAAVTGFYLRYGRKLQASYSTTILNSSRSINPIALDGGWYSFLGVQAGYTFNQIFTDGNTFRDSRSIDYKHEFIGLTLGIAYSWQRYSFTFAVNDANLIQGGDGEDTLENLTQFGTLTVAWRL